MYNKEYLFFSSLKEFRSNAFNPSGRLDNKELNTKNEQLTSLSATIGSKTIHFHKMKDFRGQYMEYLEQPKINCCSLHWLEIEQGFPPTTYDERLIEMGEKTILIYDLSKFFEILGKSIQLLGYDFHREKVRYYDSGNYNGDLTLHRKDIRYEYQNEYRILIYPTNNNPIKIPLKGLKEISAVVETSKLKNMKIETKKN